MRFLLLFCVIFWFSNGFSQVKNISRTDFEKLSPAAQKKYLIKVNNRISKAIKINEHLSPLHFLNPEDPLNFVVKGSSESESKSTEEAIRIAFPHLRNAFAQNIQFVPKKIYKAFLKYDYKKINPAPGEKVYQCGTFIRRFKDEGSNTIFYNLEAEFKDSVWVWTGTVMLFSIGANDLVPELTFFCHMKEDMRGSYLVPFDVANGISDMDMMNDLFCLMFYLHYNDYSIRRLKPGQLTSFENLDYYNETSREVKFLSSKIAGRK